MSSLALTSGWYYTCTSYCTPDTISILNYLSNYAVHLQTHKNTKMTCFNKSVMRYLNTNNLFYFYFILDNEKGM